MKTCIRTMRTSPEWEKKLIAAAAERGQTVQAYIIDCVNRDIEFRLLLETDQPAAHLRAVYSKV